MGGCWSAKKPDTAAAEDIQNMKTSEVIGAWGKILKGERPSLSIEITRECPLHCPGCYAYGDDHLGGGMTLRSLSDRKGQELIDSVLKLVDRIRPLHLSIVGGDPLVRHRELESMVPQLLDRGIHVQVVTSAFRPLAAAWARLSNFNIVVSIDGLQPEHDARRTPATYDRIIKNIAGQDVTVHCTITGQMMKRAGYLKTFLEFWTPRAEVRKVWFSLFTPQISRSATRNAAAGGARAGNRRSVNAEETVSQTGHAGRHDSAVCLTSVKPKRMRLRAHDPNTVGGLKDQNCPVPVRGKTGLQFVRMHCFHGPGGCGGAQTGRHRSRRIDLQSFHQNRSGSGEAFRAPTRG